MVSLYQKSQTERFIRIAVKDTGLGISKKNQKKLFRLFGTIENDRNLNKKGIGLGLCICKKISL
jgi:two-component system sensor histidine kinase EvgS